MGSKMRESTKIREAEYTPVNNMAGDSALGTHADPRQGFSRNNVICLAILCFVNLVNYMDRYTVSAVLIEISQVLCLPDKMCSTTQEGFLQTAFLVVYLMVAPIFGYLGDRYSRKYIMAAGVLVWGAISLTASFMDTYWSFLILRASIAIGESAFTTIAPTVLADQFNEKSRSVVLGIFYLAIPVGSGLGYVVGGAPEDWHNGLRITPGLNLVAFILILVFLGDPPRGIAEHKENKSTYLEDLKYIAGIKSFLLNVAGFTCVTFTTGALSWYGPKYIIHGINSCDPDKEVCDDRILEDDVSFLFGAILMASGIVGVLSGMILSKLLRPRFPRVDPIICGVSLLVSCPLLVYGLISTKDDLVRSFVVLTLGCTFLNMNWSISVDMSLYVIIPIRRSTAEALHLMATHALGEAGAPYIIGTIADALIAKDCPDLNNCPELDLTNYLALQRSIYLAFGLLCFGGILYLLAALWVVPEKEAVDRLLEAELNELAERELEELNNKNMVHSSQMCSGNSE